VIATENNMVAYAWLATKAGDPPYTKEYEVRYFGAITEFNPPVSTVGDLILTGFLDLAEFRKELFSAYAPKDELNESIGRLFNNVWLLPDREFTDRFAIIWNAIKNHTIDSLPVYYRLCIAAEFWTEYGMIAPTLDEFRNELTSAVRDANSAGRFVYNDDMVGQLPAVRAIDGDRLKEVTEFRKFIIAINDGLKSSHDTQIAEEFLQSIRNNSQDGVRKLINEYLVVPMMAVLPIDELVDAIWKTENATKHVFRAVLNRRYLSTTVAQVDEKELSGLRQLRDALAARLSKATTKPRPVSLAQIEGMMNDLKVAIPRLEPSTGSAPPP
jgi:hypothetical protein